MQKITALLEEYVEWVALGVGGLFLLMMVFMYVLQTPVSDKVGERGVTLATVENEIYSQTTAQLEAAMADPRVPSAEVQTYGAQFADHMSLKNAKLPAMAGGPWIAFGAPSKPLVDPGKAPTAVTTAIEAALPVLPAPQWYGASTGKSTVLTDPASASRGIPARPRNAAGSGAIGPMGPTGPMGGPPPEIQAMIAAMSRNGGMPPGMAPPSGATPAGRQPAGAATPAAPKEPEVEGTDKVWVTAAWEITTDDLARAFTAASVPANLSTVFLRIEAVREELQPDGTWGKSTAIKPLAYHSVPEMPAAAASTSQERTYNEWVTTNAQTLLVPSFYPRSAGDEWYVPGQPNPNEPVKTVAAPVVRPPAMPGRNNMRGMPGGMPPGMPGMPGGNRRNNRRGMGGFGPPPGYAAEDADRPAVSGYRTSYQYGPTPEQMAEIQRQAQAAGQAAAQQAQRMAGMQGMPMPGMGAPTAIGAAAEAIPEGYTVPRGTFVPGELNENVLVWAHDDTVQPGKTYRYKMRYSVRNPFWQQTTLVKDAEVAKKFAIYSKESEWSDDVAVGPTLRFFVATGVAPNATSARFDVYRWEKGKWHEKTFTVEPGDMIGTKDTAADFTTGYYLVDVKADAISREPVTICDGSGQLEGRSYDVSGLVGFKKEIDWVDPNAAPAAAAGMPGMGAPMGPPPGFGGPPPGFIPPGMGGPTGPRGR